MFYSSSKLIWAFLFENEKGGLSASIFPSALPSLEGLKKRIFAAIPNAVSEIQEYWYY